MAWSHWIVRTMTGQKELLVSPSEGSWERKLNGVGSGTHTFVVQGHSFGRERWRDLLDQKWNRTLVVCWDDVPVYAGIITSADPKSNGTVVVQHHEFRAILDRRFPFTVAGYKAGTAIINGRSLRGLVYQMLVLAINGAPRRLLPLSFPAYDEAGTEDRTLFNYEFRTLEAALAELQNGLNGPDIDFHPRWNGVGRLEWLIRVGTPRLGGALAEFNVTADRSDVLELSGRNEGVRMVTTVHAIGKGEEQDMRVGGAEIGGTTPALEVARNFKAIDDVNDLNAHALAEAEAFEIPIMQPGPVVSASRVLPQLLPGAPVRMLFKNHWWYLDGVMQLRCVSFSGNLSDSITLKVQEIDG